MKKSTSGVVLIMIVLGLCLANSTSWAMTNFARKYGVECSLCHTVVPKLTPTGFRFRAAGFRMPEEIGQKSTAKPEQFKLGDYFSARIQGRWDIKNTKVGASSTTSNQITFHEFTAYPIAGAFNRIFSSLVELSFLSGGFAEIENGYLRANWGKPDSFWSVRFGIFHPFEGFGAMDRPLSINRPLFQVNSAKDDQNTYFKIWGLDQAGLELGYSYKNSFLRLAVFNGVNSEGEPAQGGELQKNENSPSFNSKDIQATFTQLIGESGSGIGGNFYYGTIDLPIGSSPDLWKNAFMRFSLYANYQIKENVGLLVGYSRGNDHRYDQLLGKVDGTFANSGYFLEGNYYFRDYMGAGVRYDWYDPSRAKSDNEQNAVTAFLNTPLNNGVQFIAEYQNRKLRGAPQPDKSINAFQLRLIVIW